MDKTLSAAELPRLVVHLPDGKEVHHAVVGTEITIGRDPSNRIAISDQFVSKFHAKLLVSSSSLTLVDLGSANKTFVNGQPISQMPVRFGDELQFAGVRCRLLAPESQAQVAPAPPPVKSAPPPPAAKPAAARKPAPPPRAKAPAAPSAVPVAPAPQGAPGRSAPPPIEADPMKRLLRIGGLLILVSLAMGILLRVLLVPGKAPESGSETADKGVTGATTSAPAGANLPSTTTAAPVPPPGRAGSAEEWFDQALSYLDTGRLKEAQTAFRKVLEIDPDNTRAKTRLSLLEEEIAKKAEAHFGNARQAFQFLRYEEAIAEWEMFLTLADASDVRYVEAQQGIEQAKAKLR
jgi:hypothetical protein